MGDLASSYTIGTSSLLPAWVRDLTHLYARATVTSNFHCSSAPFAAPAPLRTLPPLVCLPIYDAALYPVVIKRGQGAPRRMAPRAHTRRDRRRGGWGRGRDGCLDALLDRCLDQLLLGHTCRLQLLCIAFRLLLRTFRRYPQRLFGFACTSRRCRMHLHTRAHTVGCTVHSASAWRDSY